MSTHHAVIVTGGRPPSPRACASLPPDALVIAADSGYDHAVAAGLRVDVLVGDLDSISVTGAAHAELHGVPVERHPADKDHTDTELAIAVAERLGCTEFTCLTGDGLDRLDHMLGTLAAFAARTSTLWFGATVVHALVGPAHVDLSGSTGVVSLLPWGGDALGVSTTGLRWPLAAATLTAGSSRGVSNEITDSSNAGVTIERGALLVITPEDPS